MAEQIFSLVTSKNYFGSWFEISSHFIKSLFLRNIKYVVVVVVVVVFLFVMTSCTL